MLKTFIALSGLLLFSGGLILKNHLTQAEKLANSRDDKQTVYGMVAEGPLPCTWDVVVPERVMSENKTQAVVVKATNADKKDGCESALSLRAPGFDLSPPREEQKITLAASGSGSLSWILTPRKSGTFEIAVSDILNTKIFGVTVTNVFGLTAVQAKTASLAGSLFGPMLTVPWWWDRLRKGKSRPDGQRDDNNPNNNS